MEEYIGKICPFCKTEIKENDEVKVCPECGIPHHATCWEENKGCTTFGCSQQHYEEQHTNPTDVCVKCGAPLGDGQGFCPKCGTPKGGMKQRVCGKCGSVLQEGQDFCPKCGTRYDPSAAVPDSTASAIDKFNENVKKKNKKKVLIPIIAVAVAAVIGIALFFVLRGTPVTEVTLSKNAISMDIGDTQRLVCTVTPDDATNKELTWTSSNAAVAKVDEEGVVTAVSEGTCKITVSSKNGKTDVCAITVEAHIPNFKELYSSYGLNDWCEIASDGSYMTVDTNPTDADSDDWWEFYDAMTAGMDFIEKVNGELGFSAALTEKMNTSTWSMGRQSQENDNYIVSWTYHPDKGLEVMYEVKGK